MQLLEINNDSQTVSARELHEKLVIGTEFAKWFSRMCEYGFCDGNDYSEVIVKNDENSKGGRPAKDYNISLDMAKQICMIQRTPEGKAIRQYLIDLEKAWNTPEMIMKRALEYANQAVEKLQLELSHKNEEIEVKDSVIKEMQPKVSYYDMILNSKSTVLITQIAQDYGMSVRALNHMLHNMGVQHKVNGQWILYARYQGNGYVQSKTFDFERKNGLKDVNMNTAWTQKGRLFLYEFLKNKNILPLIEREDEEETENEQGE